MTDNGERADVHGGVSGGVEHGRGNPRHRILWRGHGEGDEQVAGVRDGRIGEQALDVGLYEGTYVAQGHGEGSGDPEKPEASWSIDGKDHPEEDCEGGGLGSC